MMNEFQRSNFSGNLRPTDLCALAICRRNRPFKRCEYLLVELSPISHSETFILKTVLLIEDNSDDAFFIKMACQRSGIHHHLQHIGDGESAIHYLGGKGEFSDRVAHPLPDLIFLDLHLPKLNGHQVLQWIREHSELSAIPVVMLTNSTEPADISRAYTLGVTSYLRKLTCPAEFGQAVRVILKYWLELNVT